MVRSGKCGRVVLSGTCPSGRLRAEYHKLIVRHIQWPWIFAPTGFRLLLRTAHITGAEAGGTCEQTTDHQSLFTPLSAPS